jgi:hypothetical protein
MLRDTILTLFLFHLPERQFHQASYEIQEYNLNTSLLVDFSELNKKRIDISNKISEIGKSNRVCADCGGRCCQGDYNHFQIIDYIMRFNSNSPIGEFRKVNKPPSLSSLLLNRAKAIIRRNHEVRAIYRPKKKNCSNFIPAFGCCLPPEDRPIFCLIWTCRAFRDGLKTDDLLELGLALKALSRIGCEAARLWEKLSKGADSGRRQ